MFKGILEIIKACILVNFFFEVSMSVLLFTPVTSCQGLAIGLAEILKKALKESLHRFNSLESVFILNIGCLGGILSMEIT